MNKIIDNVRTSRSAFWILGLICLLFQYRSAASQCLPVPTIPFYNPVNPGPRSGIYKPVAEPIKPISVIIHCHVISHSPFGGQSVVDYAFYYSHGAFIEIPKIVSGSSLSLDGTHEIIYNGRPNSPVWTYYSKPHAAGYDPYEWCVDRYSISQLNKIAGKIGVATIYQFGQELQYSHAMVLNTFCLTNSAVFHKFCSWAHRSVSSEIMGKKCTLYEYIQKSPQPKSSPYMSTSPKINTIIYQWWLSNRSHYLLKFDIVADNKVWTSVSITSMKFVKSLPASLFQLPSGTHVVVWKNLVIPYLQKSLVVTYKRVNLGG